MDKLKITVEMTVDHNPTEEDMRELCESMGVEPTWLAYVRWLAGEEGLLGIVDLESIEIVRADPHPLT